MGLLHLNYRKMPFIYVEQILSKYITKLWCFIPKHPLTNPACHSKIADAAKSGVTYVPEMIFTDRYALRL